MNFAMMVWREAENHRLWLLGTMALATFSPLGILIVVHSIIQQGQSYQVDFGTVMLFIMAAVGVIVGQVYGGRMSVITVERMLDARRMRLTERVRRVEYATFEKMGVPRVYDGLTRNSAIVSEAAMAVLPGYAALGSLILGGLYTLMLSPIVFGALAVIISVSVLFFGMAQNRVRAAMQAASEQETGFLALFGHLLHGFKEVRLHHPRGEDLTENGLRSASRLLETARGEAAATIQRAQGNSYGFFYLMLATIAFVLPPYVGDIGIVVQSIYVTVFLLSMVEVILKSIPLITRAEFALAELDAIEADLAAAEANHAADLRVPDFQEIQVRGAMFNHRTSSGTPVFSVGPLSLTITRGSTTFVVGGNGSGKSTFLKMMCWLYPPEAGTVSVDGRVVTTDTAAQYRALYSAVFTDFHLFDQLYGLRERTPDEVNALLADFGIGHKVSYEDGRFSTTELSTGQRKRLAFAVAWLEDRPVMILDELAADQDQEFRERFYGELLPRLKQEGRTLIVVSHDDRYYAAADRVITIQDGHIASDGAEA